MREAPSLTILLALLEGGAVIRATDPKGMEEARKLMLGVSCFDDAYEASRGADALVIMTEWNEYRALDFKRLKKEMKGDVFIDLKDVYDPVTVRAHGFSYTGVGVL